MKCRNGCLLANAHNVNPSLVSSDIFGGFLFLMLPSEVASPREKSRAEKIKIEISGKISLSMKGRDTVWSIVIDIIILIVSVFYNSNVGTLLAILSITIRIAMFIHGTNFTDKITQVTKRLRYLLLYK